jgi:peroxiredoxin
MTIQRIHLFTSIGLICGLTALALSQSVLPVLAFFYCVAGYMSGMKEVSKYTSFYQFFTVFFTAIVTGAVIEYPFVNLPLLTASLFFCALGSIGRIIFFEKLTLTGGKWFEPVMLVVAVSLFAVANLTYGYGWQGWTFPALLIFFQAYLYKGILMDQKQLGAHTLKGYRVQIGTAAPEFSLPDQNNDLVSLGDFRGKRHLLLIFVRGDWCPACHMMLRTYERNNKKFQEKNIFVMAIGPDPVGVNREMVTKLGLDFKVLADDKQRTAMRYGVQLEEYEHLVEDTYDEGIPLPASFLIDKNGIVQYVSRPDKVGEFLNPGLIFPIIEKLN